MADEDLLEATMDELGDEEEEEEGSEGGNPLIKYGVLILGALVIQVVLAYFVATWWFVPSEPSEEEAAVEEVLPDDQVAVGAPAAVKVQAVYEQLDILVVNPAGTEGLRFLSTKVNLGLSSPEVELFIADNNLNSKINDRLNYILGNKTITQLDPGNHDVIKEEILVALNEFLGENAVLEIYFPSFVLQ